MQPCSRRAETRDRPRRRASGVTGTLTTVPIALVRPDTTARRSPPLASTGRRSVLLTATHLASTPLTGPLWLSPRPAAALLCRLGGAHLSITLPRPAHPAVPKPSPTSTYAPSPAQPGPGPARRPLRRAQADPLLPFVSSGAPPPPCPATPEQCLARQRA